LHEPLHGTGHWLIQLDDAVAPEGALHGAAVAAQLCAGLLHTALVAARAAAHLRKEAVRQALISAHRCDSSLHTASLLTEGSLQVHPVQH